MKEELANNILKIRIIELEDKLIDLIVLSIKYEHITIPYFDFEIDMLLKEIKYLEN